MIAKFEKTSLSNQTIPQGHMFSLGSKIPRQVLIQYHKGTHYREKSLSLIKIPVQLLI